MLFQSQACQIGREPNNWLQIEAIFIQEMNRSHVNFESTDSITVNLPIYFVIHLLEEQTKMLKACQICILQKSRFRHKFALFFDIFVIEFITHTRENINCTNSEQHAHQNIQQNDNKNRTVRIKIICIEKSKLQIQRFSSFVH